MEILPGTIIQIVEISISY